jgi:hypothetical protein
MSESQACPSCSQPVSFWKRRTWFPAALEELVYRYQQILLREFAEASALRIQSQREFECGHDNPSLANQYDPPKLVGTVLARALTPRGDRPSKQPTDTPAKGRKPYPFVGERSAKYGSGEGKPIRLADSTAITETNRHSRDD